jgi:hypothetical protein
MVGLKTLISKFETLIEHKLPRVHAHQHLIGLPVTFRACAWFLSLFFGCLKDAHLLRTWDLIFYHYHHNDKSQQQPTASQQSQPPTPTPRAPCNAKHAEAVLSCIGLALLKTVEERLCKCTNSTDLGMVIQELGTDVTMLEADFFELALGSVCSLWEATVAESVASSSNHSGPGSGKKRRADGENVSMTPQPTKKLFGSRKSPRTTGTFWSRRKRPDKENSEPAAEPNKVTETPAKAPRRSFFSSPPPFRIRK